MCIPCGRHEADLWCRNKSCGCCGGAASSHSQQLLPLHWSIPQFLPLCNGTPVVLEKEGIKPEDRITELQQAAQAGQLVAKFWAAVLNEEETEPATAT